MADDFGYGQQEPNSSSDEVNKIWFLVQRLVAQLDTMKLVQVVAVHGGGVDATGTVDVTLLVNQIDGNGNAVEHGTVYGLPWSRAQGGQNAVIVDPEVGDIGWVVASDRDTSKVRSTKARANPGSYRRFNVADGVYAGCALGVAPNQYLQFTSDGARLVDKNGNSVVLSDDGIVATDKSGNALRMTADGVEVDDDNGNAITMAPAGVTVADHFGNSVATTSGGISVVDANGNTAILSSTGVAVTSAGNLTLTDSHSNVLSSGAGGWTATPASGHPFTVAGSLVVQNDLQLGGGFLAVGGGTYAGALHVAGEVVAKFGTASSVGLTTHTHSQPADSHGDIEAQTLAPTAGT